MTKRDAIVDRVAQVAKELRLTNLTPQIAACLESLHATSGIDVAVFGRFKAGKSSFLNHLTGRDVLPVGVVPLTAVITRLRAGPAERAEVRFLDGRVNEIPLAEVGLYVGEKENPDNTKRVASVEIELPSLQPVAPLQFVDTPGLGSAFIHNTEVALNWLPRVGAALVAVSADAPLSERDLALLEELRRHTPKIVLLLTKADLLTEAQRNEVLDFVRRQLRQKQNADRPVFFYSIKPEFAGLKAALERDLLKPLITHHEEAAGQILRHKLASLVEQTLNYLRVALAAATQTDAARQALRERLADERGQFELLREELSALARQWSASALEDSLRRLEPARAALQKKITAELDAQFAQWHLRLPPLLRAWREWSRAFLLRELSEVSRAQQPMFCEPLQKARAHLARTLRAFQDRLAGHVKTALGVSLTPHEFALEAGDPSAPPVDVGYAFDAALEIVAHILPMALVRRPVERILLRKARYETEKDLSRLAATWSDRVAAVIAELTRQAEQLARDELAALERMLEQTKSNESELRAAIKDLSAMPL